MSKNEKLDERVRGVPRDLRWNELVRFLGIHGYKEVPNRKSGSRRWFIKGGGQGLVVH